MGLPVLLGHLLRGSAWRSTLLSEAILSLHGNLKLLPPVSPFTVALFSFFKRNKGKRAKPAISFTLPHPPHALPWEKGAGWPLACPELQRKTKALFSDLSTLSPLGTWPSLTVTFLFKPPPSLGFGDSNLHWSRQPLWGQAWKVTPPSSYYPSLICSLLPFFLCFHLYNSILNTCQKCGSDHVISYNRGLGKEHRPLELTHALRLWSLGGCHVPIYYVYMSHTWPLGPAICTQLLWSPLILTCLSLSTISAHPLLLGSSLPLLRVLSVPL